MSTLNWKYYTGAFGTLGLIGLAAISSITGLYGTRDVETLKTHFVNGEQIELQQEDWRFSRRDPLRIQFSDGSMSYHEHLTTDEGVIIEIGCCGNVSSYYGGVRF